MPRYGGYRKSYGRRSYRKRSSYGSNNTFARYASAGVKALALARSAWNATKYIRGLVNSETYKAENTDSFTVSAAGYTTLLTNIAQGDSDSTRTGSSILVKGLKFSFTSVTADTTPISSVGVRVMILQDNQQVADASGVTIADLLENTTTNQLTMSPLNSNIVGRYSVLMDKRFVNDTVQKIRYESTKNYFKMQHHMRYNGSASSDIQKGGIYLVVLCDDATVGKNQPTFTYSCRTYYHDN